MKTFEQAFYNMRSTNAENSASAVVFQAQRLGFLEGWMVAMNAIGLPESSAFRDPNQIPLANDSPIQASTQEQFDKEDDEEGEESSSMAELTKQIDSHVVVIDMENPVTNVTPRAKAPLK